MPTVLESLNQGLHEALATDEKVIILGEDILDPYGGAFKVTQGLSSKFPERVLTTPISEAGVIGIAAGMALRGLRPVVEIMFGDFLTLGADQLINHVAKYRWMYNDQVRVPLVVRTPMGGRRGYGPTHSQTLEKHFLGTPGLQILAPTVLGSPGELLAKTILHTQDPVIFIENKLLYLEKIQDNAKLAEFELKTTGEPPVYTLRIKDTPPPQVTLAAYGYMAELTRRVMITLAYEDEIFTELVVFTGLSPFEISPLLSSIRQTRRLVTVEEGGLTMGWGAEILALSTARLGPALQSCHRVAAADLPIPASSPLEQAVLPDLSTIRQAVQNVVNIR
jgi:pyruvate/2-oxoglutarate/acetoin dehydrogenase E1 component